MWVEVLGPSRDWARGFRQYGPILASHDCISCPAHTSAIRTLPAAIDERTLALPSSTVKLAGFFQGTVDQQVHCFKEPDAREGFGEKGFALPQDRAGVEQAIDNAAFVQHVQVGMGDTAFPDPSSPARQTDLHDASVKE